LLGFGETSKLPFFCQLDDDYSWFAYRRIGRKNPAEPPKYSNFKTQSLDIIFDGMVQFLQETPSVSSIAFLKAVITTRIHQKQDVYCVRQ
jgi:hypothetical protein